MKRKTEGRRSRGHQRMRWLDGITDTMNMNMGKSWEMVRDKEAWHAAVHGVTESWTVKKTECQRSDAFELWCWSILLKVPWTARRSNQSILWEINPEYSLEGRMLNLKLQYFGHLWEQLTHWKIPDTGKV